MKAIIKKFKKLNKSYKIMFFIIGIINLISIIFITQGLLLLKNIENVIRIIFLILVYINYFIFLFISILLLFSKKNKLYITNFIFILLISTCFIFGSLYINKTYNMVDKMNKDTVTYSSSLVVMKDTEFKDNKDFVVGMINDEKDIEGHVLANKLIDKKKLNNIDIKYYDNYLELISDLYNGKVNGILISSSYKITYSSYENYENIGTDTKVIYTYKEDMENQDIKLSTNKSLTEPFTLLILGVDSEIDGLKANTAFNGDTMMLVTFNPKTLSATVFSVPRDTYVPIACNGNSSNKINSSAVGGATCVIKTLQNLTGIDIDYYVKINFKGVVDLVNALDGVDVNVPVNFCEQDSNREFGDSEICLNQGEQTLNGEQALALSRHRHSLPLGDFQRVQHQQLVVEAIAQKAKAIRSVNKFYDVLDAVSKNIETNVKTEEMLNLYNVGKSILLNNDSKISIDKTYLTGYDLSMYIPGLGNVYTFQYYEQSLNEIVKAMKVNLNLEKPELIKSFNFSVNYTYEVPILGKQYYTVKRNEALPSFIGSSISYLESWASARNITVYKNYIIEGMDGYDENSDGIITDQNVIKGTLVSNISSITVNVIKSSKSTMTNDNSTLPITNNNISNNDNDNDNDIDDKQDNSDNNEKKSTTTTTTTTNPVTTNPVTTKKIEDDTNNEE